MNLTIAVPTYDRNQVLHDSVLRLLPQMTEECTLLIIDNCSPTPVGPEVQQLLRAFPGARVRLLRNGANIGGNANVMRCFEACDGEWLWVLGDDDVIAPDAVSSVLDSLKADPQCLFFSFCSPWLPRSSTTFTRGLQGFIDGIDEFGKVLFLSTSVFHISEMRDSIAVGYQFTGSFAPHVAALLVSISEQSSCCISSRRIIMNGIGLARNPRLSFLHWPSLLALQELPLPYAARVALCSKLKSSVIKYMSQYVKEYMQMSLLEGESKTSLFAYDLLRQRVDYFNPDAVLRLRMWATRWLIKYPRMGSAAYWALKRKRLDLEPPFIRAL